MIILDFVNFLQYIHPTLTISAYLFVFINAIYTFTKGKKKYLEITSLFCWFLCLGGLVTGMIWAQFDWGSYWSWDPKETATLFLFLSISFYLLVFYNEKYKKLLYICGMLNIVMVFVTLFISQVISSLHTHY